MHLDGSAANPPETQCPTSHILEVPASPRHAGSGRRQVALPGAAKQKQKQQGGVRGGLLLLGLLLVVASGGGFWYIVRELDVREEYLVTARTLQRWEIAGASDFTVVEANLGDAAGVPPQAFSVVVGKWATGRIPAGTVVTPGMFQSPPLSNEDETNKVLIEISLPADEAPGGSLETGDKVALFGAESSGVEAVEPSVGLIGVLELEFVRGRQDHLCGRAGGRKSHSRDRGSLQQGVGSAHLEARFRSLNR